MNDGRYLDELSQAFLLMSGIIVSRCEKTAVCLVKTIAAHINDESVSGTNLNFAFDCINECATHKNNLQLQLLHTFGSHLDITALRLENHALWNFEYFCKALTVNTTLTTLNLRNNYIDASGAASLSDAIKVNTVLTDLNLRDNRIGASGAGSLLMLLKSIPY